MQSGVHRPVRDTSTGDELGVMQQTRDVWTALRGEGESTIDESVKETKRGEIEWCRAG